MEENQTPTSPIAGEPVALKHIGFALHLVLNRLTMFKHPENYFIHDPIVDKDDMEDLQQHLNNIKDAINRDLMGLRASLMFAYAEYADTEDGWATAAADLAYAVHNAMKQIDVMLGWTEPTEG
jgi:hypothetical protein